MQAWLYFGVLDELFNVILDLNVSLSDFIDIRDGQPFLTTSQLRRHIRSWEDKQYEIDRDHYSGHKLMDELHFANLHSALAKILIKVRDFSYSFDLRRDLPWARCLDSDFLAAIFILADTLKAAGLHIWREWQPAVGRGQLTIMGFKEPREIVEDRYGYVAKPKVEVLALERVSPSVRPDLFEDKFAKLGRCPNEYGMLRRLLFKETTGLFLASRLRRPFSDTELSHTSCTAKRCLASQIETGTFQTRHTAECDDAGVCRIIRVDSDVAAQRIRQGRIPLISIKWLPNQPWVYKNESSWARRRRKHKVELAWEETENYIAISHVWSHGLGNPKDNALPECQLRRLKLATEAVQLALKLREEPAIWIDTLCIPVQQHHRDMRKKAIGTISGVFRKAKHVLVLDADLERTSISGSRTELCTRILLCGWMSRLWTLNEAVVSSDYANCHRLLIMFDGVPQPYN